MTASTEDRREVLRRHWRSNLKIMAALLPQVCLADQPQQTVFYSEEKDRQIPAWIYGQSTEAKHRSLIIISHGYGVSALEYTYIANHLANQGCIVVSIQHDLPSDPPLATNGNLYQTRMPAWTKGIENINNTLSELAQTGVANHPIVLIGHSNGGDMSTLFAHKHPEKLAAVITLDHRRVRIPPAPPHGFLSIRSEEFSSDLRFLPTEPFNIHNEKINVLTIQNSKHIDFTDSGPIPVQTQVISHIEQFLAKHLLIDSPSATDTSNP